MDRTVKARLAMGLDQAGVRIGVEQGGQVEKMLR
jgi:hypothetical protein